MVAGKQPVGIVGVGLMGMACAQRLLGAGLPVVGFDVDGAKLDALEKAGGGRAASIADLGRPGSRIVLAVFNTDQVEQTVDALLAVLPESAAPMTVICVSTCDPDRIAGLAARLPAERLRFVEAPVSGTSEQVAKGDGLGLIGGDPAAADAVADVLQAICPRRHHLGAAGNGGRAKLAINLILGINRAALAEGLVFAERMGLDPANLLAVARDSAAYSQIMDVKGAKMVAGDTKPAGKLAQSLKDFHLMREQASRLGQTLPLAETYIGLVEGCVENGEGEFDNSAVIREIRRRAAKRH
jgi:3-hydroxyisobutyrate dehydrogenase-like beta-hydroxyacid dehydrogenase